jgi:hypothetical protein
MRASKAAKARCLTSASKKPPQVTGPAVEFVELGADFRREEHGERLNF